MEGIRGLEIISKDLCDSAIPISIFMQIQGILNSKLHQRSHASEIYFANPKPATI